ncbi:MAG: hypothetical protein MJY49_00075 [Bacteroidales bacterium]|nr:hypothetical protein [Bacteroidales bacterium]
MENIETTQMTAVVETAKVNDKKNDAIPATEESSNEEKGKNAHRRMRFGGTVEQVCMLVMAAGIAAISVFSHQWLKIVIACICGIVFLIPFLAKMVRSRNGISAEKVCSILRKRGLSPIVSGDEIRWVCNGKESVLRIRGCCQVEIAREYDIPSITATIEGNKKAALETMKEVYLAKVSVREGNGNNKLAFSAESLCISAKELSAYIPMCMEILDLAEDRQREHISEIRNNGADKSRRKIGFVYA